MSINSSLKHRSVPFCFSIPSLWIKHLTLFPCFVYKTPASSSPFLSFPFTPSFLLTFSLHDLCPPLTLTSVHRLFAAQLITFLWAFLTPQPDMRGLFVLCLLENGRDEIMKKWWGFFWFFFKCKFRAKMIEYLVFSGETFVVVPCLRGTIKKHDHLTFIMNILIRIFICTKCYCLLFIKTFL